VAAGAPLWSSSASYLPTTPAERQLARLVGTQSVGFGDNGCFGHQLGIVPDDNVALGVRELADYDPLIPKTFTESWRDATGDDTAPATFPGVPFSVVCPAVTSVATARQFGVAYVVEPAAKPGPPGTTRVGRVGAEDLYRVPGAGPATLVPLRAGDPAPAVAASGALVPVTYPGPASWRLETNATTASLLRLRLTAVPGWHATIDGRPLPLTQWAKVMLEARVPPGHHVIELRYWPDTFSVGLVCAAVAVSGLCAAGVAGGLARRRGWRYRWLRRDPR
jgi:hypothetical protein